MESREREEYLLILAAFKEMIQTFDNSTHCLEHFTDMVIYRASALIDRVLEGLGIDFERALELIQRETNLLTPQEELERERIVAAWENLIDFAIAQEYALVQELPDELSLEDMEQYESLCQKYNEQYAIVENEQVLQAAMVAAFWIGTSENSYITYNTQNDERVRAWHQSYDGLTYLKSEFPPELIPPIEWACRCFLTSDGYGSVFSSILKPAIKVNPIFSESLATGGRIFTDAHPYFKHKLPKEMVDISNNLKQKLYA